MCDGLHEPGKTCLCCHNSWLAGEHAQAIDENPVLEPVLDGGNGLGRPAFSGGGGRRGMVKAESKLFYGGGAKGAKYNADEHSPRDPPAEDGWGQIADPLDAPPSSSAPSSSSSSSSSALSSSAKEHSGKLSELPAFSAPLWNAGGFVQVRRMQRRL